MPDNVFVSPHTLMSMHVALGREFETLERETIECVGAGLRLMFGVFWRL